jgi:ATP-dependent RNA helicase SUPV3L1/SUV3
MRDNAIEDDWFARQLAFADRVDGDIDTLANRIAHIRTWTYVANRPDWLADPAHWQDVTRGIEDKLSDALHEKLTQRFVDRRTSVLMRRLRENAMLEAEITSSGDVLVEGQHIGNLLGFRFAPDSAAEGPDGKTVRAAAQKALTTEIESRAEKLGKSENSDFVLTSDGAIRWRGEPVAKLSPTDDVLAPAALLLADEHLTGPARDTVQNRLDLWVKAQVDTLLKPLMDLKSGEGLEGLARGIAFRIVEGLGILERQEASDEIRQLDQDMRASLRKHGVRFGAYTIFVPALLKPAPSQLLAQLWALKHGELDMNGMEELPQLVRLRPDIHPGRPGDPVGALQGRRVPRVRPARRACRHPGAPCRSHPAADCLETARQRSRSAGRRNRNRRRLYRDGCDDVAAGLCRRRFFRCSEVPRLPP